MNVIYLLIIVYIIWRVSKGIKQNQEAKKPENIILGYEGEADRLAVSIRKDRENENDIFCPLPDVLMSLDRLEGWYNRISEIDKHNKEDAVKDAEDWRDSVNFIHDLYSYHLKCNADVDESDWQQLDRSMAKLREIEKRWGKKLDENPEKYWKDENEARTNFLAIRYKARGKSK